MKDKKTTSFDAIKKECEEIQELLLRDEMSHTDLANWFLDFCTRIGCGEAEITRKAQQEEHQRAIVENPNEKEPQNNKLPEGYIVGVGNEKGNTCKICGRVFTEDEVYADKGADSLCKLHAVQKGIMKVSVWEYEKMKKEQGL